METWLQGLRTTVRFSLPMELILAAISATSVVSQPSVLANVAASVSLPNTNEATFIALMSVALNGGTSMMNGADRFCNARFCH